MRDLTLLALGAAAGALLAYPTALAVASARAYHRGGAGPAAAAAQLRARVEHYATGWSEGYDACERAHEARDDDARALALLRLAVHAKHDEEIRDELRDGSDAAAWVDVAAVLARRQWGPS
jgi:hypothetical protein